MMVGNCRLIKENERKNYAGSQKPSMIEGKGVRRCLHHAALHQEMDEGELLGIRGVACCGIHTHNLICTISLRGFAVLLLVHIGVCYLLDPSNLI